MFAKILVPLDGSALAEAVLPYVKEIGRRFGSEILLLQVLTPLPMVWSTPGAAGMVGDPELVAQTLEIEQRNAREYLSAVAGAWGVPGARVCWEIVQGSPADQIVLHAHQHSVDLIAMSTHGRGGLQRLVFGSVADQVLRTAGLPILLIRPQQEERQD